jgi:hypothetical protein
VIANEFGIGAVPHYMLVGKDGRIISSNFAYLGNPVLKNRLMKLLKE